MNASNVSSGGADYSLSTLVDSPRKLSIATDKILYPIGSTAVITATVQNAGIGLTGATVQALINRPGVASDTLTLVDQGGGVYQGAHTIPNAPGYLGLSVVANGTDNGIAYARQVDNLLAVSPSTVQLTGTYSDNPIDNDNDGKYEALAINVSLNVAQAGDYLVSGDLVAGGTTVAHSVSSYTLVGSGTNTVTMLFNGGDIKQSAVNGPYTLTNLTIADQQNAGVPAVWKAANIWVTSAYSYTQFADQTLPSISASVNPTSVKVGDTATVTVSLDNVPTEGYTSAEFTCVYDNWGVARSNIVVGGLFGADPVMVESQQPSIPEVTSFIVAIAGSRGAKATTSGPVFTFDLTAPQVGAGQISIKCDARVSKGDGVLTSLPSSGSANLTIGGTITPTDTPTPIVISPGTLNGQVLASKPLTVILYDSGNNVIDVFTCLIPEREFCQVNPDFTFEAPAGTYTVEAKAEGFLRAVGSATITSGGTTTMPTITLLAGDINGNDVIDEWDAMSIGMNYNTVTPTAADLNNDGIINVLDLELLAKNYRKTGPVAWQ